MSPPGAAEATIKKGVVWAERRRSLSGSKLVRANLR
jgi:hypothetical protein